MSCCVCLCEPSLVIMASRGHVLSNIIMQCLAVLNFSHMWCVCGTGVWGQIHTNTYLCARSFNLNPSVFSKLC